MEENPRAVRGVAQQAEQEEEQAQALAGAVALVLDDLRDAGAEVQQRGAVA